MEENKEKQEENTEDKEETKSDNKNEEEVTTQENSKEEVKEKENEEKSQKAPPAWIANFAEDKKPIKSFPKVTSKSKFDV